MSAFFVLQNSHIQTRLTRYFAERISEQLNTKVSIGYVNFIFFNQLLLQEVYIEDQAGDTLLFAGRINAGLRSLDRKKNNLVFSKLFLKDASVHLKQDSGKTTNIQFIIDALASPDTTGTKWNISIESIELQKSFFSFTQEVKRDTKFGVNFQDIEIFELDLLARRLRFEGDTILFNLRHIGFQEKSGFRVNHLAAKASLSSRHILLNELKIETGNSNLDLNHLEFSFRNFGAFKEFITRVNIDASVNSSILHFEDIAYFAPKLQGFYKNISFRGEIKGRVNNFKGNNLEVKLSEETSFAANINFIGLPEIEETFIFLDLLNFATTVADLENLQIPGAPGVKIILPEQIKKAGKIFYEGKFTGFISDFVAYGNLTTSLGKISTDLLLRPGQDNQIQFIGKVNTEAFLIGDLLNVNGLGKITLNAQVEGSFLEKKGIRAQMEGKVQSLELLGYNYQQISLSGELSDNTFDGTVSVTDPNIVFQFLGKVDFSEEIPQFDFSAYASRAQLFELNIDKSDSTNNASFLLTANFSGDHPDNLEGYISLLDFKYQKDGKLLQIADLSLNAGKTEYARKISLSSNFLEGEIIGNYEFATLGNSFSYFISKFLPAYSQNGTLEQYQSKNNFDFQFRFKESQQVTDFFLPWLEVSPGSEISGKYYPEKLEFSVNGKIHKLSLANNVFYNFTLESATSDSIFKLISESSRVVILDGYELDNFELNSLAKSNNVDFEMTWENQEIIKNKGEFNANINFDKRNGDNKPLIDISISPSRITIKDSIWHVSRSRIQIDSTAFTFNDFMFSSGKQMLNLYGKISEDPFDSLYLRIDNINLDQFDLLTKTKKFAISGILDSRAKISGIFSSPFVDSDITIDNLIVNKEPLGTMTVNSSWNHSSRAIHINAFSERENDRLIGLSGNYFPENHNLDFLLRLNKLNVRIFDGFIDEVFRDIRGIASGEASLKGTLEKPLVNGNVTFQKASLLIDYLNTRYSFTHSVDIRNNNIFFNNLRLTDSGNNVAVLNGSLRTTYFSDIRLDLSINARNFLSLNTTQRDNELFYGRVFSTGVIKIAGTPKNIVMDISAKTEKNTEFYIPLTSTSEVGEINFLAFVGSESSPGVAPKTYEVDLSGIQLNFDLEVTPDADIQIIFDSKIGDIIRGRGSGNLKLEINTQGTFNMFGEYVIEQGDYLFTLQNVINKRFEVQRGGRIGWNGDPYDANVELLAIYRVRVPLSGLFVDESEQYTRRLPVECQIQMRNKLMNPELLFNIDVPTADADTRRKLQGVLNTEEKTNRQFLSLLIINNFLPEQDFFAGMTTGNTLGLGAQTAGVTTASEFFSNQLSNLLSQISRDFDIGVNYRPGDEVSPEELELALSTQLFNDRLRINGNVDVTGRQTNASSIVGDFDVDFKLTRTGKVRLKAFNRVNDHLRYQVSPYTQGIGLFYREEFDTFTQLLRKYWRLVTFRNEDEEPAKKVSES